MLAPDAASSLPPEEVEQLGGAREGIDLFADRELVEVEPAVTGADLGNQVDMAELVAVLRGVVGEALRFPTASGLV